MSAEPPAVHSASDLIGGRIARNHGILIATGCLRPKPGRRSMTLQASTHNQAIRCSADESEGHVAPFARCNVAFLR